MKVVQNSNGFVSVEYCPTHSSHSIKLAHLPIPKEIKDTVAAKLHEGVAIEKILDSVRDSVASRGGGRGQIIQRQDILNIQRHLNIDSITKHSNDLMSTCAWVEEMEQMAYSPVLTFKPQGVHDTSGLAKDDFMLAIQTEFQKDAMLRYGTKGILVDATHGTTQYDFLLITALVVDDHGEGLPVAWAISNKEDLNAITQFFRSIHNRIGNLDAACFMSDCAEQYFNAWSAVFWMQQH